MKRSYRIGFKTGIPLLPNAGIFVVKISNEGAAKISGFLNGVIAVLEAEGYADYATRIIFEARG